MNLQILALQTIMNSGVAYDATDPVMKNVIFDVSTLSHELDIKISELQNRSHISLRNINSLARFSTIHIKYSMAYDDIIDQLSDTLFDDMTYGKITTPEQIEWKEYFHGLYELVVFQQPSDRTQHLQMINDIYKYYDVLEPPKTELGPNDPLYVDVKHCQDLFKKLKNEHKKMLIPKLFKKMKQHVKKQIDKRIKLRGTYMEIEKLYRQRNECEKLIQWANII